MVNQTWWPIPHATHGHPTSTSHPTWFHHQECDWRRPLWICCCCFRTKSSGHWKNTPTTQTKHFDCWRLNIPGSLCSVHHQQYRGSVSDNQWSYRMGNFSTRFVVVEWADDMVMQALADMSVNIDVLTTIRTDECPESHYTCRDQPVGTNTIGLIEERHYVGLERLQTVNHQEEQSSQGSRREKDTEDLNSLLMKLHCLLTNSPLC